MKSFRNILLLILAGTALSSCEKLLDEPIYSQLAPENLLSNEEGIRNVLYSAYAEAANLNGSNGKFELVIEEWPTDILWQTGGGENGYAVQYINFTLDAGQGNLFNQIWRPYYLAIRNANILLDNIDGASLSDEKRELFRAEARFVRAWSYYKLYTLFGPVPLRKSTNDELELARATDQEMQDFIESEFLAVIPFLPDPGEEEAYGRAHVAAAYGFLCKFYLNTRQWQKSAEMAQHILDLGYHSLYPVYKDLFKVENEGNREMIWVKPAFPSADRATANGWMNAAFPSGFQKDPVSGLEFQSNWVIFASEYRLRDAFVNSFEPGDNRTQLILNSFINTSGDTVSLLGNDNARSFKYWPDPNAVQQAHGNDIPVIRYADILLSRAEALLELNGLNLESIGLVNQVRERAGLDDLSLADFSSGEALREHILKERGWELYSEGKRRNDLIRMEQFISGAQARGISGAQPFRVLYPIPQTAMDSNPALVQNEGY